MSPLLICLGRHGDVPYLRLGDVAPLVRREVVIDPEATYTELGVRSFNKGTFHLRSMKGAEFTWQGLFRINKDDLVFSNIMAWEGAVALANPEDDGCIGNHRMLTCDCDRNRVDPAFLALYFKTPEGLAKLVAASTGTVARNRTLTAGALDRIDVPVPPLAVQRRIASLVSGLSCRVERLTRLLDAADEVSSALLLSLHHKLAADRTVRLADLLELHEYAVTVRAERKYLQVGVRGFGGGLFAKPAITGTETSYKAFNRLYGDAIVLSQVKGWEGAIALCPEGLSGMYVSPEYRTFRCRTNEVSPQYLGALVKTEWFWSRLQGATRGVGARRERTRPEQFLGIELPMPALSDQLRVLQILTEQAVLKTKHTAIRDANAALIPATLERIFQATEAEHA